MYAVLCTPWHQLLLDRKGLLTNILFVASLAGALGLGTFGNDDSRYFALGPLTFLAGEAEALLDTHFGWFASGIFLRQYSSMVNFRGLQGVPLGICSRTDDETGVRGPRSPFGFFVVYLCLSPRAPK